MSLPNAYQSPGFVPHESKPGARQLQYMEMFTFVFQNPNWGMNVLWGSLCVLVGGVIPIVPLMVFLGYLWECVELMHRRQTRTYPDFDTNRLSEYLVRGVWPVLVVVVYTLVLMTVAMPLFFIGFFIVVAVAGNVDPFLGIILGMVLFFLWWLALMLCSIFLTPMLLRAGLAQDFGQAFNFGWIMNFVKVMFFELVLGSLFIGLGSLVLGIVGFLLLFVGVYPAQAISMMASTHLSWQLYEIYLERGGEPIPLKAPAVPMPIPMPVALPPKQY